MSAPRPGFELPLLLIGAFRELIDELHAELALRGHPGVRPGHGVALQAIGPRGATAAELGRRMGVTKQAAGKTLDALERLGYVSRVPDPADGRARRASVTEHGVDCLVRSAEIFEAQRAALAQRLGEGRLGKLEHDLELISGPAALRVDLPGWFAEPGRSTRPPASGRQAPGA